MRKIVASLVVLAAVGLATARPAEAGARARYQAWRARKAASHEKRFAGTCVPESRPLRVAAPAATATKTETLARPKVTRAMASLAVDDARQARYTSGFDAAFKDAVAQIHELHDAGHISDAQDLAARALHSYMDHNNLEIGHLPAAQVFFARTYATQAGLNDILHW